MLPNIHKRYRIHHLSWRPFEFHDVPPIPRSFPRNQAIIYAIEDENIKINVLIEQIIEQNY